jgi:hypothetical protein
MTIYSRYEITDLTQKLGKTKYVKSWVYFVTDRKAEYIKIGVTNSLMGRLSNFMHGLDTTMFRENLDRKSLYVVFAIPGTFELENALHKKFKENRHKGEWFKFIQEIDALIDYLDYYSYMYYYYIGDIERLSKSQFAFCEYHRDIGRLKGFLPSTWDAFILHIINLRLAV